MKERPIIFSGEMVRAILDGRKTQTRRVVKAYAAAPLRRVLGPDSDGIFDFIFPDQHDPQKDGFGHLVQCPYGVPGDRLWVRETYFTESDGKIVYRANGEFLDNWTKRGLRWRSPVTMFRSASRITLEITNVRVERLQDISEADAVAEGFGPGWGEPDADDLMPLLSPQETFQKYWDSISKHTWESNPWVWVIEFKRIAAK